MSSIITLPQEVVISLSLVIKFGGSNAITFWSSDIDKSLYLQL